MNSEGTNLLLLSMSAFWSSSRWPIGHLDELQKAEKYPIRWSFLTGFTVYQSTGRIDKLTKEVSDQ